MLIVRGLMFVLLYAYHLLTFPLLAGGILVWGMDRTGLLEAGTGWLIALAPLLYLCWLTLTLSLYSLQMQNVRLVGWKKPRRCSSADAEGSRKSALVGAVMLRAIMIWSLPVSRYFLRLPFFNRLVLYSIATEVHVGRDAQIWGYVYDPDLTSIGDNVIIGGGAAISAHALSTREDGSISYVSAPIEIGDRAVIGGEARVGLGARIGADAIVEAGSVVAPFTEIGPGEIWSGNPACLERHRVGFQPQLSEPVAGPMSLIEAELLSETEATEELSADDEGALRQLVAENLDLPGEEIAAGFHSGETDRWDSLAQLGISAGLHSRFGIQLTSDEAFSASSLANLRELIMKKKGARHSGSRTSQVATVPANLHSNPELLPLLPHSEAAQLLSRLPADSSHTNPLTIHIAATFTVDPIAPTIRGWCAAFGIEADVRIAGFDQVEQSLLDPGSEFRVVNEGEDSIRLILTRPEDLLTADGQSRAARLLEAVRAFGESTGQSLLVSTLPPVVSSLSTVSREDAAALQTEWHSALQSLPLVELHDFAAVVERVGVRAAAQADMDVVARCPYSPVLFQELGIEVARKARSRFRPPAKVLALDADNTLWGGIVGEDGLDGLQLSDDHPGRSFRLFQQTIRSLKERGVMLVLVSRNDEADVMRVLDEHPGMVLRREDFVASRINWAPKSQNLKELAEELNVGLDSFVFVDDDPANRAEVAANAPKVLVVPLPENPVSYTETLTSLWCFDGLQGTAEDRTRTQMMQQQSRRDRQRTEASDQQAWLKSIQLRAEMRRATERDLPRLAQLVKKTNQFNLSLKRRSLDELRSLITEADVFAISAADQFGDYGMIGLVIAKPQTSAETSALTIDTFLLSCRVLGRGIETAALHELVQLARERGHAELLAPFVVGPRNTPIRKFL
ncbi:MAG: HAD-IIIC family phosphatase, partial [Planctomycetes bacterium]|nr:HAD-IIIC family phosphatase [Planctomycetota bacterium]